MCVILNGIISPYLLSRSYIPSDEEFWYDVTFQGEVVCVNAVRPNLLQNWRSTHLRQSLDTLCEHRFYFLRPLYVSLRVSADQAHCEVYTSNYMASIMSVFMLESLFSSCVKGTHFYCKTEIDIPCRQITLFSTSFTRFYTSLFITRSLSSVYNSMPLHSKN